MHELSLADSILDLIERQLGCVQVLSQVDLCVGPLSGVSAESLEFCFQTISKQRGFGEPILNIQRTKVNVRCKDCHAEFAVDDLLSNCPHCASWSRTLLSGDELQLLSASIIEDTYV